MKLGKHALKVVVVFVVIFLVGVVLKMLGLFDRNEMFESTNNQPTNTSSPQQNMYDPTMSDEDFTKLLKMAKANNNNISFNDIPEEIRKNLTAKHAAMAKNHLNN